MRTISLQTIPLPNATKGDDLPDPKELDLDKLRKLEAIALYKSYEAHLEAKLFAAQRGKTLRPLLEELIGKVLQMEIATPEQLSLAITVLERIYTEDNKFLQEDSGSSSMAVLNKLESLTSIKAWAPRSPEASQELDKIKRLIEKRIKACIAEPRQIKAPG